MDTEREILQSLKPEYLRLILSGRKTVEIRKNKPCCELPFKVYMYCSKSGAVKLWRRFADGTYYCSRKPETAYDDLISGRVVGYYICSKIEPLGNISTDPWKYLLGNIHEEKKKLVNDQACLTEMELLNYSNGKFCFGWHISNVTTYIKAKNLSEFYKYCEYREAVEGIGCECNNESCSCQFHKFDNSESSDHEFPVSLCGGGDKLVRPPQSWCYVNSKGVQEKK